MYARKFAQIGGVLMLAMGVFALVPALSVAPLEAGLPGLKLDMSYGLFLGIFPLNIVNKLALIAFGIAGLVIAQSGNVNKAIMYARTVCVVMGAAAILGAIPQTSTFFGYWPLFGAEIWAHGAFAILGGYFGYGFSVPSSSHLSQLR